MMVNTQNNPIPQHPWQSVVPQQMPWISPHGLTSPVMQFGNQPPPAQSSPIDNSSPDGRPTNFLNYTAMSFTSNQTTVQPEVPSYQDFVQAASSSNPSTSKQYLNSIPNIGPNNDNFSNITQAMEAPKTGLETLYFMPECTNKRKLRETDEGSNGGQSKQRITESLLFKKFDSLNLDNNRCPTTDMPAETDDDIEETNRHENSYLSNYVYLLFKEKKNKSLMPSFQKNELDIIAQREREKLSKAVVLWNPPPKNGFLQRDENGGEEEEVEGFYRVIDRNGRSSETDDIMITDS